MKKKLKRFKIYALFMALVLMTVSKTQYVFAAENEVQENLPKNDMELSILEDVEVTSGKSLTAEELDVTISGEEPTIYGSEEQISAISDDTSSTLYTATVSGCLAKSGDYALYAAELPAGSYLQARLTLPNNNQIDYDLVLYDSALSIIKASDYLTFLNQTGTLEESVGYKAISNEKVYIGIFSSNGGSDTEEYKLDFSIATNYSENNEPNENAKEAVALNLGKSGASVSGALNSAIDNDWYSFTVLDSLNYDKIRLDMDFVSKTNDYNIEIYRNLSTDYYAMQLIAYGKGGQITLSAGTYFLRVVCTNTLNDFNAGDFPTYKLSVIPVTKVDKIKITKFSGYHGATVDYPQGTYYRIDENEYGPNQIMITGWAYYEDIAGNKYAAPNVKVDATITDLQWSAIDRPDMDTVYGSAITDQNGSFTMNIYLNPALGGLSHVAIVSTHYYDLLQVYLAVSDNTSVNYQDYFYLLKLSDFSGIPK